MTITLTPTLILILILTRCLPLSSHDTYPYPYTVLTLILTRFLSLSLHGSYPYPYTVFTHYGIQVMIDHANEEQDVRDLSNFLALLLRGAEVSTGASFIHSFIHS